MDTTKSYITCPKCGAQSALGRVFCEGCGGRLDLAGFKPSMTVKRTGEARAVVKILVEVVIAAAFFGGIAVGLSMIPQTSPIGVEGSRGGASQVVALTRAGDHLLRGQSVSKRITEADLNGYFRDSAARTMRVDAVSVDIEGGVIRVRIVRRLARFDIGSWHIQPRVSYQLTATPVENRLRFGMTRKGLMPLFGPFKSAVIRQVYRRMTSLQEWQICKSITNIQVQEDALDVTLERR